MSLARPHQWSAKLWPDHGGWFLCLDGIPVYCFGEERETALAMAAAPQLLAAARAMLDDCLDCCEPLVNEHWEALAAAVARAEGKGADDVSVDPV